MHPKSVIETQEIGNRILAATLVNESMTVTDPDLFKKVLTTVPL